MLPAGWMQKVSSRKSGGPQKDRSRVLFHPSAGRNSNAASNRPTEHLLRGIQFGKGGGKFLVVDAVHTKSFSHTGGSFIFSFMNRVCILVFALFFFAWNAAAQQEGYVQGNGVRIFYRSYGNGTPLLIINGGPGLNSDGFQELAQKLSGHNRVIIYDQRGTGHSVLPVIDSSSITMALMLDDIESLRKGLGIQQWIVLGHSFGGMLASYYATQRPSEIRGMILSSSGGIDLDLLNYVNANINARLTKEQRDSFSYWTQKIASGDTSSAARSHRAAALANAYVVNKSFAPKIAERLAQLKPQINGLIWQDLQKIHFDCSKQLASFRQPVLIIQGRQDIIEARTGERAHRVLQRSKFVLIDHSIHYGWLDNPDVFFREVNGFLAAN